MVGSAVGLWPVLPGRCFGYMLGAIELELGVVQVAFVLFFIVAALGGTYTIRCTTWAARLLMVQVARPLPACCSGQTGRRLAAHNVSSSSSPGLLCSASTFHELLAVSTGGMLCVRLPRAPHQDYSTADLRCACLATHRRGGAAPLTTRPASCTAERESAARWRTASGSCSERSLCGPAPGKRGCCWSRTGCA